MKKDELSRSRRLCRQSGRLTIPYFAEYAGTPAHSNAVDSVCRHGGILDESTALPACRHTRLRRGKNPSRETRPCSTFVVSFLERPAPGGDRRVTTPYVRLSASQTLDLARIAGHRNADREIASDRAFFKPTTSARQCAGMPVCRHDCHTLAGRGFPEESVTLSRSAGMPALSPGVSRHTGCPGCGQFPAIPLRSQALTQCAGMPPRLCRHAGTLTGFQSHSG